MSRKATLILYIFILIPWFGLTATAITPKPIAKEGVLDLTGWNPSEDDAIELSGEWAFFWNQLLPPAAIRNLSPKASPEFVKIPGDWKAHAKAGQPIDTIGYATYRLLIQNLPKAVDLSLDFRNIQSAYTIFANGEPVVRCGKVGTSRETTLAAICPQSPTFSSGDGRVELVFQIANYHHARGGFWQGIKLGLSPEVIEVKRMKIALDLFLIGAILTIGLYHLGLFASRKDERSTLYFCICCLLIALRSCLTNTYMIFELFPDFHYPTFVKLDYLTLCLPVIAINLFFNRLFPNEFSATVLKGLNASAVVLAFVTLLTPSYFFSVYVAAYQAVVGLTCLNVFYVMLLACYHRREGASVVLVGGIIVIVSVVNDILYSRAIIDTAFILSFGLFLFFFSQAYVISNRFATAYNTIESLTFDLERQVRNQTDAVKDLLNNTGQGFFSFDNAFRVQPFASLETTKIFGQSIVGKDALTLLFPEEPEKYREFLEVIFESEGKIGLVRDVLPKELKRNEYAYEILYNWIPAQQQGSSRILIVLTDISQKRKLEKMLEKDQHHHQQIIRIASDKAGFLRFYNSLMDKTQNIHHLINGAPSKLDLTVLARDFHTFKGGASSYGFRQTSRAADEIESTLETLWQYQARHSSLLLRELDRQILNFQTLLQQETKAVGEIIPKQLLQASRTVFYDIAESKTQHIETLLADKLNSDAVLQEAICNLKKQPVRNLIRKCASDARALAFQLGKRLEVQCEGEDTQIIHERFAGFFPNLIHLVHNAVDHGIEAPKDRKEAGKSESGTLVIDLFVDKRHLHIRFEDDGQGISLDTIRKVAMTRGIMTREQVVSLDEKELLMLITHPKYSSRSQVSLISGNGAGLAAVASSVLELNGQLEISSEPGKGTCVNISFPIDW